MKAFFRNQIFFAIIMTTLLFLGFIWNRELFFEFGYYIKFTRSILEKFDFNIINLIETNSTNYLATITGNHPTINYPTISAFLSPFFLYTKILNPNNINEYYGHTHILANIFYVIIGFIYLSKLNKLLSKKFFWESTFTILFGSSFIWYFLFESTTTNIFAFSYSIIAYYYFSLLRLNLLSKKFNRFVFGLIIGLGLVIRIELFWLSFLALFYLLNYSNKKFSDLFMISIGASIPLACFAVNEYQQFHQFTIPIIGHMQATSSISPWPFFLPYLKNYIWGPNGYLITAPIFIFIAIEFFIEIKEYFSLRNEVIYQYVFPILIGFTVTFNWLFPMGYQGRYQLAFLIIYILTLQNLFIRVNKSKIIYAISFFCIIISIYSMIATLSADGNDAPLWLFKYKYSLHYFFDGLNFLTARLNSQNIVKALLLIIFFAPIIYASSILLTLFSMENSFQKNTMLNGFFVFGISVFTLFTLLNSYFNPINVSKLKKENYYDDKVIIKTDHLVYLESVNEVSNQVKLFSLINHRCDLLKLVYQIKHEYFLKNRDSFISAPNDIKNNILLNENYVSPIEFPIVSEYITKNEKIICPN